MARRPYWPWGVGLDKRQARRLRRRLGTEVPQVMKPLVYAYAWGRHPDLTLTKES